MRKSKKQKGITLIALIITTVVLLILAAVAISSIQNDEILGYATNASKDYNQAAANEQDVLQGYLNFLNNGGLENGSGGATIGDATVGTKVTSISTINGEQYTANNPVIPVGFMAKNNGANWDATDLAAEVKKGLVISDGTSEFVWIPVPTISEMAKVTSGTDANGRTNYEGILYDFAKEEDGSLTATANSTYVQGTNNYREPANLSGRLNGVIQSDKVDRFTTELKDVWDKEYYQESFNKMVESVIEYKGFYVGRYEMSYNTTTQKAESRANATSVYNNSDENNWWGLYEKATTYSASGVISEMIWGCQYDAMMRWMQGNNIDVTSKTPTDTNRNVVAAKNSDTNRITGSSSNDILNNIYDILGNSYEWTQEASSSCQRVFRGGGYSGSGNSPRTRVTGLTGPDRYQWLLWFSSCNLCRNVGLNAVKSRFLELVDVLLIENW